MVNVKKVLTDRQTDGQTDRQGKNDMPQSIDMGGGIKMLENNFGATNPDIKLFHCTNQLIYM